MPQRVSPPAPLTDITFMKFAGPPPLSLAFYLAGSILGAPSQHSGGPPASCCLTGTAYIRGTWNSPHYHWILPCLSLWGWRTPPRIGTWLQRPSSATAYVCFCCISVSSGAWWAALLACAYHTSHSKAAATSPLSSPLSVRKSVCTWKFPSAVLRYALLKDCLSPGISLYSAPGRRTPHRLLTPPPPPISTSLVCGTIIPLWLSTCPFK